MDLIIDAQFFKDNKNCIIPKEVAVVCLHKNFSAHWIVGPTRNSKRLRKEILRQNNWLTLNHHGLEWYEGDISVKKMYKNLEDICKRSNKIYVRGKEKVELLSKLTTREIINLEQVDSCPAFQNLPWCETYCMQHAIKPSYLRYACALNNACRLKIWLLSDAQKTKSSSSVFELPLDFCDEFSRSSTISSTDQISYSWSLSGRSNSSHVRQTLCICS
jgi:hypothetical protein